MYELNAYIHIQCMYVLKHTYNMRDLWRVDTMLDQLKTSNLTTLLCQ